MNAFKLQGNEHICGKNRNVYLKMNKKNTALGKTRYIKYKREFIKLSTFIKEHYNDKTKKRANYGKKEKAGKITIINNIDDIKDKKIRALFKKTFKKNAKIYIYASKKLKRGGGEFNVEVKRNNDRPLRREPRTQVFNAALLPQNADQLDSDPYPYKLKVEYNKDYDDIIYEITKLSRDKTHFERINNLKYKVSFKKDGTDVEYYIRPHIDFTAPYKRFIISFYVTTDNFSPDGHPDIKRWIKLPIHVSLFINDMIEKRDTDYKIAWLNTGHIHITSDDKIANFNIKTSEDLIMKTKNGAASSRGRTARTSGAASARTSGAASTHTYLFASDLQKVAKIMKEHGKTIFKDWSYDNRTEKDTEDKKFTLFAPKNNKWGASPGGDMDIALETYEKKEIFEGCFKKLHYIISNIFYILHINHLEDEGLENSGLTKTLLTKRLEDGSIDQTFIPYIAQPQQPTINIRYINNDETKRSGLIDIGDLKKATIISARERSRERSRERARERSRERPREIERTLGHRGSREGRGHPPQPTRGVGYSRVMREPSPRRRYGGVKRRRTSDDSDESYDPYNEQNYDADVQRTTNVKVANYGTIYGTTAPQADIIPQEEIEAARNDAKQNLQRIQAAFKADQVRRATEEREKMQKTPALQERDDVKTH